ncbi:transcription factor bHLH150-like [Miscanthus floridulus]|uniref:transcription factor bHLH150-like n=1 Tax=Miscanthus floridulus TaxID=154761 RepID=UPI00345AC572
MISSPSPSPSPSPSSSRTPKGGSATPPPRNQASKWRSGAVRGVYGRRLLDALRATGGGQPRAVKAAADSALALTARGQTRWSRAILLAGAACSRRRVLVKAGGKVRRRRRPPLPVQARDNAAAAALLKGKGKEKDKVQERLRVLGRLVPGCRKLPAPALLEEAADYVAALQMQVSAMRALTDALAAAQLSSSPADAEAGR